MWGSRRSTVAGRQSPVSFKRTPGPIYGVWAAPGGRETVLSLLEIVANMGPFFYSGGHNARYTTPRGVYYNTLVTATTDASPGAQSAAGRPK